MTETKPPPAPVGTHLGHLSREAKDRRTAKNARNRNRAHPKGSAHGLDMPVPGANRPHHSQGAKHH